MILKKDDLSNFLLGQILFINSETGEPPLIDNKLGIIHYNKILNLCEKCISASSYFNYYSYSSTLTSSSTSIEKTVLTPSNSQSTRSFIDLTDSGDEVEVEDVEDQQMVISIDEIESNTKVEVLVSNIMKDLLTPFMNSCIQRINSSKSKNKLESNYNHNNLTLPLISLLSAVTLGCSICLQSYYHLENENVLNLSNQRPSFITYLCAG